MVSVLIYDALRRRGLPVSFLMLRLMIPRYVSQYRQITLTESGSSGALFYHWIIAINLALVAAMGALFISLAG